MDLGIYPRELRLSDYLDGHLVDFSDARNDSKDFDPPKAPCQIPFNNHEPVLKAFQQILNDLEIKDVHAYEHPSDAVMQSRRETLQGLAVAGKAFEKLRESTYSQFIKQDGT